MMDSRMSVRLDDVMLARLRRLAIKKNTSVSREIRGALIAFCEREEREYREQRERSRQSQQKV